MLTGLSTFVVLLCLGSVLHSFSIFPCHGLRAPRYRLPTITMGRAANVRAATKARTDAAKAKNNGRYAKKIIVAVKAGGPDPESNRLLAQVIADAKISNVPKDIITRNIEKGSTSTSADYREGVFEFYGYGGAGILVSVLTDNDNRAAADVNLVAKKHAIKHAAINSVKFKFATKARLDVPTLLSEEQVMNLCLESGVDDYALHVEADGGYLSPEQPGHSAVYVNMQDMPVMRDAFAAQKLILSSKLVSIPVDGYLNLSNEDFDANMAALDAFNALDDVDLVEHNIELSGRSEGED